MRNSDMKEVTVKICQAESHLTMINVCNVSEASKINVYESSLTCHKTDYEKMFSHEQQLLDVYNKDQMKKLAEEEEIEKQKLAHILEKNEQQTKEAVIIEQECALIERECCVLAKRNKAIMLKLKRKLVESEEKRRELMMKCGG